MSDDQDYYPEDDYPDDGGNGEDDPEIQIENLYVEAQEQRNTDKQAAAKKFEEVIDLETKHNKKEYTLKSLKFLILIYRQEGKFPQFQEKIVEFTKQMDKSNRDERNQVLREITISILQLDDLALRNQYIDLIMTKLWSDPNLQTSWTRLALFLINQFLELKDFGLMEDLINQLKVELKENEQNNSAEASNILEVYSIEIQYYLIKKNVPVIKKICRKARKLNSVLNNPRIMGIIQETTAQLLLYDKFFEEGYNYFNQAFRNYQATGNFNAREVLKYLILASILSCSETNPAMSQEAQAFRADAQVLRMFELRRYWQENNLQQFNRYVDDNFGVIIKNDFMREFKGELKNLMALQKLKEIIYPTALEDFMKFQAQQKEKVEQNIEPKPFTPVVVNLPYNQVQLSFLQVMINAADEREVQKHLTQLILEQKIFGGIDDIQGIFQVYNVIQNQSNNTDEKLFANLKNMSGIIIGQM